MPTWVHCIYCIGEIREQSYKVCFEGNSNHGKCSDLQLKIFMHCQLYCGELCSGCNVNFLMCFLQIGSHLVLAEEGEEVEKMVVVDLLKALDGVRKMATKGWAGVAGVELVVKVAAEEVCVLHVCFCWLSFVL